MFVSFFISLINEILHLITLHGCLYKDVALMDFLSTELIRLQGIFHNSDRAIVVRDLG